MLVKLYHSFAYQVSVLVKDTFPGRVGNLYRHTRLANLSIDAFLNPAGDKAEPHLLPHEAGIDHEPGVKLLRIEHPVAALVAL